MSRTIGSFLSLPHDAQPDMAAAPPKFEDSAKAKKALAEVVDLLLPAVQPNGELKLALDKAHAEASEEAALKQKIMMYCMPAVQKIMGTVLTGYGFAPGPMGILQGFASLNQYAAEDEGIKEALAILQSAAMQAKIPDATEVAALKAKLQG